MLYLIFILHLKKKYSNFFWTILHLTMALEKHPEIGQVEELLIEYEEIFRFLLSKRNYKIIYWINIENQLIEIVDVFDVRQNPSKIKKER